ncbi:spermatogenesis associated 6-like protein isoform X2 [Sceloporus undulatus]|uniref:spermatogenesis associated 6-like protein isoform X2 n=1 Tax=Sceloporus undulatus TaxID=8520 RepID=UPI001C4B9B8F|nr:spermatogenesis associated 6-like protein isoform X2 [Sceloporus undulatus]
MPLKVVVELQVHAVSCPGVYLTEKSDVYLHVCILGQCKETDCLPPIFPLLFHEKMWFEKIFEKATDPVAVVELLEKNVTKIRLSELIPSENEELAFYKENTRDFLFPEPKLTPPYPGVDRELLMNKHPCFPGIAPKLEFSTRTTITELPLLPRRWYRDSNKTRLQRAASASPRRRSVSPARGRMAKSKNCKRFTRILRSRSPSPSSAKHLHEHHRESQQQQQEQQQQQQPSPLSLRSVKFKAEADHRPPFVVRHVDTSKAFAEQTPPQVQFRNVRQSTSPTRNSHKFQLKRALSFDSWKATCPAAKVIREPDEQYSSDRASSSSPETKEPIIPPRNTPAIPHSSSFDSSTHYQSRNPRGRRAQHRLPFLGYTAAPIPAGRKLMRE